MSDIKVISRYLPNPPPRAASSELRDYLQQELDTIADAVNSSTDETDSRRATPHLFLGGVADDVILTTTPSKFINYTQGGSIGIVPLGPDLAGGNMTLPIAGAYQLTVYVAGLQPGNAQNDSIRLLVDLNGVKVVVASIDVATNQTDDRILSVSFTRVLNKDSFLSLWIDATGNLGDFEVLQISFEMEFISTIPENLDWFPPVTSAGAGSASLPQLVDPNA